MTDTELDRQISILLCERPCPEALPLPGQRRTGRAWRRAQKIRTNDALMCIVTRHYVPYVGYVDYGFTGKTLLHSGKYFKCPRSSKPSGLDQAPDRQTDAQMPICPPKRELLPPPAGVYWGVDLNPTSMCSSPRPRSITKAAGPLRGSAAFVIQNKSYF